MSRPPLANWVDMGDDFLRVQRQMLGHLAVGQVFDHPGTCGAATEQGWLDLLRSYLPRRYRVSPAFVVDADGRRSRQIDIAVYDNLYSPLIFPHDSVVHVPAESAYAIFEVTQSLTRKLLADAGRKAASVRALRRNSAPVISAGAARRPMAPPHPGRRPRHKHRLGRCFQTQTSAALREAPPDQRLDFGCALRQGTRLAVRFSEPEASLIFFILRLFDRLRTLGTAPALDLMQHGRSLNSLR